MGIVSSIKAAGRLNKITRTVLVAVLALATVIAATGCTKTAAEETTAATTQPTTAITSATTAAATTDPTTSATTSATTPATTAATTEATTAATTAVTTAATTAVTTTATTTASLPNTVYPLTVTDITGRSVKINQKPVRIVTLLPTATETLYTVGGTAIARDSSSKFPVKVLDLPTVGSAYAPSVDAIAAQTPDLIIIEALSQAQLIPSLEKLGAPVVAVRAASVNDVYNSLTLVGQIVDRNNAAAQAIQTIKDRLAATTKITRTGRSVLILIGDANSNIYAAKPASYPGTLSELLKQTNPAASIPDSGPYPGFGLLTAEQALAMNPDVILCISPAPAPAPSLSSLLPRIPGFKDLSAVKNAKVSELDPVLFLQAQGPRIADAVDQMAVILLQVAP